MTAATRSTAISSSTADQARRSSCAFFALPDLLARLEAAGFVDVRVRREPNFAHGVWWPGRDGWPITARRPATASG